MSEILSPTILNVTCTLANTEYSQALPAGCLHYSFQLRDATKVLRFAHVIGKVAGPTAPYATVAAGKAYTSPEKLALKQGSETIYFATPDAAQVVELVCWISY